MLVPFTPPYPQTTDTAHCNKILPSQFRSPVSVHTLPRSELMPPCFCSFNPPSPSISNFISSQPHLSHCQTIQDLKKIHAHLIKTALIHHHPIAASRLLQQALRATSRDMGYAYSLFRHIPNPNLFAWNSVIRGFSNSGRPDVALQLFIEMLVRASVRPDRRSYPAVFKAYAQLGLPEDGAQLHGRVVKVGLIFDPFVRNSVIHMYANCGRLDDARNLFDEDLDVVAWNSMVMGLAKCGEIGESWRLFCNTPCRNEVSWSTMISGFVRNGKWEEALDVFREMQEQGIRMSEYTLASALNACAKLGALEQGKWIRRYVEKNDVEYSKNPILATAVVDMYCKCGDVESARQVFTAIPCKHKGLSCWNSMMLGLATNGCEDEAFEMFTKLESSNLRPDTVSFIGVLTASNHAGQVDKAREYFKLMTEMYRIEPTIQHYGCMVDVLGRAGLIKEAEEFVRGMPVRPDAAIWGSLLSAACMSPDNVDVAEWAAHNLILSDHSETSAHVLMSKAYATLGHFEKAIHEREKMKTKQMGKQPGSSLIEVNGEVHEFVSGGSWHSHVQNV